MPRLHRALFQIPATVLILLQVGCGAARLGMCAPHTKEEGLPIQAWVECFDRPFSHGGMTHSVFCLNDGTGKPPVVLLHELTGLSPGTLAYAEELSKDFTVYVPLLFGEKGKFSLTKGLWAYWFEGFLEFFPGGEWGIPSQGSAPIVDWLRGVVKRIGETHRQQRIGIIGNCMTGPIPLALLDHPQVGAAVVAQPALPLRFWWHTESDKQSLGLSGDDLERARRSTAKIYGLRFEIDCMSDPAKQQTLRNEFGERFINGEIPANTYQLDGKPVKAHSTLIGSWRERGEAGRPSRDARESVRHFLLKELSEIPPEDNETIPPIRL
jgi:dienelactone hydrolase